MIINFKIEVASENHIHLASEISKAIEIAASLVGIGLARRSTEYITEKMMENKAIIATTPKGEFAGFCYIETFSNEKYVSNSGLIVLPEFRKTGLAKLIKDKIFALSLKRYPDAKIFGLTTALAVMKINSELGYKPVTYSELTKDYKFWKGCETCSNYEILQSKQWENCICTAMVYDSASENKDKNDKGNSFIKKIKIYERLTRLKQYVFLRKRNQKKEVRSLNLEAGIKN